MTTQSKNRALAVILLSATLTIMAGSIIAPILNLMRENLGVAPSSVGIIITTHGLFMALFSPIMGSIIDRKGAKGTYILSLLCYGVAGGAGLLIDSFWVLLVSRAFLGIALSGIFTAINVLILNMYEGPQRNKVMGWRGSAQSAGGIAWPLLGGALGSLSWHLPFAVYMLAIPIGLAAIIAIPVAETPQTNSAARPASKPSPKQSVPALFRQVPVLLLILALTFFSSILLYVIVIFLPQRLEAFGITNTFYIGLFIAIMTTCGGLTSFFYGKIREHVSYHRLILTATSLWTLAFLELFFAGHPAMMAVSVALYGIAQGLIMPTLMVWIGEAVPIAFRGRFSSYLGTAGFIGQFLSPIFFGPIMATAGLHGVFGVAAAVGFVWMLLILIKGISE